MMRFVSLMVAVDGVGIGAATGEGVGVPTIWPGDGGGGGTRGRGIVGVAAGRTAGVATDGVGRAGYGVPASDLSGVARRMPSSPAGVAATTAAVRTGVMVRGVIVGLVSGVVAPTLIRMIAPQTLHRALTPFGGTFAGSTRNTDRQS